MPDIISALIRPSVAFMERLRLRTKFIIAGTVAGIVVAYLFFDTTPGGTRSIVALAGWRWPAICRWAPTCPCWARCARWSTAAGASRRVT